MNDGIAHLEPKVPHWALNAGCPYPAVGEGIREYCDRIGLSYADLIVDLTPRTGPVVHMRLAEALIERCPRAWQAHLTEFVRAHAQVTNGNGNHR